MFGCRTMRMICSSRFYQKLLATAEDSAVIDKRGGEGANLESFVLKNSFDGCIFTSRGQFGLKHYSKAAIANNLALGVLHFPCLAGNAILDLLSDDFYNDASASAPREVWMCMLTSHAQAIEASRSILRHA